jgi:hypothetical protein
MPRPLRLKVWKRPTFEALTVGHTSVLEAGVVVRPLRHILRRTRMRPPCVKRHTTPASGCFAVFPPVDAGLPSDEYNAWLFDTAKNRQENGYVPRSN